MKLFTILISSILFIACSQDIQENPTETTSNNKETQLPVFGKFTDAISDEEYKTVKIGEVVWMAQNLNTAFFSNGDPILESKSKEEWEDANTNDIPSWCYLNFDEANGKKYGKIYNTLAITDPRGLAPQGWKIAGFDEWEALRIKTLNDPAANIEKASWKIGPNEKEYNTTGFSALAGGYSDVQSVFGKEKIETAWWIVNSKVNPSKLNYGSAVTDEMRDEAGVHVDTMKYNLYGSVCRQKKCTGTTGIYGHAYITVEVDRGTILQLIPKKLRLNMSIGPKGYVRCVRK